jgi:putative endonuclease
MAFMYLIECADGTFYVGSTRDLTRRLYQHRIGAGAEYTRRRLPLRLVYFEEYQSVGQAFAREKQVQGWVRSRKRKLITSGPGVVVDDDTTLT